MPHFLTQQECYLLLERELPPDLYPNTAPSGSFPTADHWAVAACLDSAYGNLSVVYDNYFPQSAVEKLVDWEVMVFGQPGNAGLTIAQRQQAVLAKVRSRPGIRKSDIQALVTQILSNTPLGNIPGEWLLGESGLGVDTAFGAFQSSDFAFDIIEWGQPQGGFFLGDNQLGVTTFLSATTAFVSYPLAANIWTLGYGFFGLTADEWSGNQADAYTYEIRCYFSLTQSQFTALDQALTAAEPARSAHVITDNLAANLKINGVT